MRRSESVGGWRLSPVKAHCLRPRYGGGGGEEESGKLKSVAGGLELTRLASSELEHRELNVMGFCLGIGTRVERGGEEGGGSGVTLELKTWLDGSIRKTDFIRRG